MNILPKSTRITSSQVLVVGLISLFFLTRFLMVNKEFVQEETYIIKSATAISHTGYPSMYIGEPEPSIINLWKPPGLVFILAAVFKFMPINEVTARSVIIFFSLAQLFLMAWFINREFNTQKKPIFILTLVFYALHPYIIQNHIQIDIDGSVYSFFATLFMFSGYYLTAKQPSIKSMLTWAIVFQLAFSTKFEPTLMLSFLLGVYIFTDKARRKTLLWLVPTSIASIAGFFLWFYLYNFHFGHPEKTLMPVNIIGHVFSTQFIPKATHIANIHATSSGWMGSLNLLIQLTSWLSVPFVLLVTFTLFSPPTLATLFKKNSTRLLVIWSFGLTVIYLLFGYNGLFPRYFAPTFSASSILLSVAITQQLNKCIRTKHLRVLFVPTLLSLLWFLVLKFKHYSFIRFTVFYQFFTKTSLYASLSLLVYLLIIWKLSGKTKALLTIFIISIFSLTLQDYYDVGNKASMTNSYGNWGYRPSGLLLKRTLKTNSYIISEDPTGYYFGGRYYDVNLVLPYREGWAEFSQLLSTNPPAAVSLPENKFIGYLKDPTNPLSIFDSTHPHIAEYKTGNILTYLY